MHLLEKLSILLGDKPFKGYKDQDDLHYFADRIKRLGVLDFGFIDAGQSRRISLAANKITSELLVKSIVATAPGTTGDEVKLRVFRNGQQIALQQFSNNEMPLSHPTLVLTPDLEIEVEPKYASAVFVYVEPVDLIFRATPT